MIPAGRQGPFTDGTKSQICDNLAVFSALDGRDAMVPIDRGVPSVLERNMTRRNWRALALAAALIPSARDAARRSGNRFIPVPQDGGEMAIETPTDESNHHLQEKAGPAPR